MFKTMNRLSQACECLTSSVEALRDMYATAHDFKAQSGNVEARVEELERSRMLWEAQLEGEVAKAKAEYRKASSAEKRAQTAANSSDDPFEGADESPEEFAERYAAYLRGDHGDGSDVEGVPRLHTKVAGAADIRAGLRAQKRGA